LNRIVVDPFVTDIRESVETLIAMVERQEFLEAIARFYAEHATMQENNDPPRVGLEALLEGERYALANRLRDIHVSRAASYVVDGNRAAINWEFEYTNYQDERLRLNEIAYQLWEDGKIVQERHFYDPARIRL